MPMTFNSSGRAIVLLLMSAWVGPLNGQKRQPSQPLKPADLKLTNVRVIYHQDLDLLVFEQKVQGAAGETKPKPAGMLDGAPVLAYVFRTTLKSMDVGFGSTEGLLALVVTSHPDFDDTPLWDESNDGQYDNDGAVYHTHWVVLVPDERVPGKLAVKPLDKDVKAAVPKTHPGMPLYLDSPGFAVVLNGNTLKVLVPAQRVNNKTEFGYDAVTAFLKVSKSAKLPMLGVYEVLSSVAKDRTAGFSVEQE